MCIIYIDCQTKVRQRPWSHDGVSLDSQRDVTQHRPTCCKVWPEVIISDSGHVTLRTAQHLRCHIIPIVCANCAIVAQMLYNDSAAIALNQELIVCEKQGGNQSTHHISLLIIHCLLTLRHLSAASGSIYRLF